MRRISRKSLRWLPIMLLLLLVTWFFSYSVPLAMAYFMTETHMNAVVFSLIVYFEIVSSILVCSIIFGLKELNGYISASWYLFSSFFVIFLAHLLFVEMSYHNTFTDEWFTLAANVTELFELIVQTCGIVLVLKGLGEELRKAEMNGTEITVVYYGPVERAAFTTLFLGFFTSAIKLFSIYIRIANPLVGLSSLLTELVYMSFRVVLFLACFAVYRAVRLTCFDIYTRASK